MSAWIGLGSNIGDGPAVIDTAIDCIDSCDGVRVLRRSGLYRSKPWGYSDQDPFTNAVVELRSALAPLELLAALRATEQRLGRRCGTRRWGPRVIDLDILLLGERILVLKDLIVPHPRMHRRSFVLVPLGELDQDLTIPGRGTVRSCLARLNAGEVRGLTENRAGAHARGGELA